MGRVRGANAAAAVVLGVGVPAPVGGRDPRVSVTREGVFDHVAALTDAFYRALGAVHEQTRAWEASAPADEKMHPATMARLWDEALESLEKKGEPAQDGFGRPLVLPALPQDLLALVDPRMVVVDGRLPEDVESWTAFVAALREEE